MIIVHENTHLISVDVVKFKNAVRVKQVICMSEERFAVDDT